MNSVPNSTRSGIAANFPALQQQVHGHPLVYLDNAATTQKPQTVIDAMARYYENDNANVHRGVHALSVRATDAYEGAREKARAFLNAPSTREIVFVRGTTEGINLVAATYGNKHVGKGDEVILTAMEHHSNIVPWQMLCDRVGATLRVAPIDESGDVIMSEYRTLFSPRTKIAALSYISNAIGTVNPVAEMIAVAHEAGVAVLLDGAQAAPHLRVDVQTLDADFFVISGHKMYGPTGIGVLYARESILEELPPYQGGGDMIASVSFEKTTYNVLPHRFEAGTPNVAGAIGLAGAIDYMDTIGIEQIVEHEVEVISYAVKCLEAIPEVRIVGTPRQRAGVISFVIDGVHPHDAGTVLDHEGIAIRAGHHCSQPLMDFYRVPATNRASFAIYNTHDDVDRLVAGIARVMEVFK